MIDNNEVEVAVYDDSKGTRQIVEFDLNNDSCKNIVTFLDAVNDYLITQEYIEDRDENSLTNLEFSKVRYVTSSKEIIEKHLQIDKASNKLIEVTTRFKNFEVSSRN